MKHSPRWRFGATGLLLILVLTLLYPSLSWGTAAFVQEKDSHWFGGSGVTESITFSTNVGASNLVVVGVGWATTTATISSIKDSNNVSYTLIDSTSDGTNGAHSTYYLANSAGGTGASTITVTWSADPGFGFLVAQEASGVATSSALDVHGINVQAAPGTGANAITSGSVSSSGADFVFGVSFDDSANNTAYSAGTNVSWVGEGPTNTWFYSERIVQTFGASIAADFTFNATFDDTITAIAAFKPSGGAVACKPSLMLTHAGGPC